MNIIALYVNSVEYETKNKVQFIFIYCVYPQQTSYPQALDAL